MKNRKIILIITSIIVVSIFVFMKRNKIIEGFYETKDIEIPIVKYDGSVINKQEKVKFSRGEIPDDCNIVGDEYGYCENENKVVALGTLYGEKVPIGGCKGRKITQDPERCHMMREIIEGKKYTSCGHIKGNDLSQRFSWCPVKGYAVPRSASDATKYKYEDKPDMKDYGCVDANGNNRLIDPNECDNACALDPNSKACLSMEYDIYGGESTGDMAKKISSMEGFANIKNVSGLFVGVWNVISNLVFGGIKKPIETMQNMEKEYMREMENNETLREGLTTNDIRKNLEVIKTTRDYDKYINAWNNFARGKDSIMDNNGEVIYKKEKCSDYFNPASLDCYQKTFLESGCVNNSRTKYPQSMSDVKKLTGGSTTLASLREKMGKIVSTMNNSELPLSTQNNARKACLGSVVYDKMSFFENKQMSMDGLKLSTFSSSNLGGHRKLTPDKTQIVHNSNWDSIVQNGDFYYISVDGFVSYPQNAKIVEYVIYGDDGVRLSIDGNVITPQNKWKQQSCTQVLGKTQGIPDGKMHRFKAEFYEHAERSCFRVLRRLIDDKKNYIDENGNIKSDSKFQEIGSQYMFHA